MFHEGVLIGLEPLIFFSKKKENVQTGMEFPFDTSKCRNKKCKSAMLLVFFDKKVGRQALNDSGRHWLFAGIKNY